MVHWIKSPLFIPTGHRNALSSKVSVSGSERFSLLAAAVAAHGYGVFLSAILNIRDFGWFSFVYNFFYLSLSHLLTLGGFMKSSFSFVEITKRGRRKGNVQDPWAKKGDNRHHKRKLGGNFLLFFSSFSDLWAAKQGETNCLAVFLICQNGKKKNISNGTRVGVFHLQST